MNEFKDSSSLIEPKLGDLVIPVGKGEFITETRFTVVLDSMYNIGADVSHSGFYQSLEVGGFE